MKRMLLILLVCCLSVIGQSFSDVAFLGAIEDEPAAGGGGAFLFDSATGTQALARTSFTNVHVFSASANRIAFIGISWDNNDVSLSSVTVGGVAATELWDVECADCGTGMSAAYVLGNAASGTQPVVVTWSGIADTFGIETVSFTGGDTASPNRTPATAFAFSATATVTAPGVQAGDIVVDVFTLLNTGGITAGANQTSRYEDDQVLTSGLAHGTSTQAGADGGAMSWTMTAGNKCWVTGAVALKPAP